MLKEWMLYNIRHSECAGVLHKYPWIYEKGAGIGGTFKRTWRESSSSVYIKIRPGEGQKKGARTVQGKANKLVSLLLLILHFCFFS